MEDSQYKNNSIFWMEVERIRPNPYQPRREFDEEKLRELADSIRMYGLLQPLTVTRHETLHEDGGLSVEYELISGERRLRASKLAGLSQVPVVIHTKAQSEQERFELAIIENLQREDLTLIDRARAFERLTNEFGYNKSEIGRKVGKSREYVSNSMRVLALPESILALIIEGRINEGHTRPLLMLADKPEEQKRLAEDIARGGLTVRDAEEMARRNAQEKVRRQKYRFSPELLALEKTLAEKLHTRVRIEMRDVGGRLVVDFFTPEDLEQVLALMQSKETQGAIEHIIPPAGNEVPGAKTAPMDGHVVDDGGEPRVVVSGEDILAEERARREEADADLYSLKHFSV